MEQQENSTEEEDNSKTYKSFCFTLDKEFVKYLTQISISYIILSLATYKLIMIENNSEDKSIYISLITLILGIYTNPTKIKKQTIEEKN